MATTRKYRIGQVVYLRTDPEQLERLVVCICDYGLYISYMLGCGTEMTQHLDYEITEHKNVLFNLN